MTDLAATEADTRSTVIDTDTPAGPSGGGVPRTLDTEAKEPAKEPSLRDTVAAAVKESAKEEAPADTDPKPDAEADKKAAEKGAEKPEGEEKPSKDDKKPAERAPDGKFAAKQAEPKGEAKPAEPPKPNGQHIEAPSKFLPDAKEKWLNVPRPVQRDVANLVKEHETEVSRYREAAERYEPIRQFDEMVRQNGRAGIHETLAEVAQLEDLVAKNPLAGLNQILLRAGPRKADGQPYSLFELATAIVNSGQDNYHKAVSSQPQQQQQRGPDPEVAQLKAELAQIKTQTLEATVIAPFKADHPRYDELQGDIAFFLQSGKIPASLSPHDRLEAAYDMAVRINPASHAAAEPQADLEPARRADDDFSGSKSIKSAPGAVSPDLEPDRGGSTRDVLMQELRRAARK